MKQAKRLPLGLESQTGQGRGQDASACSGESRAAIIHLDLDAFYAACEVLENPELAGKPVLVGGRPEERGVVATASYPARDYGVHSAMAMHRAVRLCPRAIVLPPRFDLYRKCSRRVMAILGKAAPVLERVSIDEAYLDLTDRVSTFGEAVMLAGRLQERVRSDVGLSASLGVATNKLVAKIASDHDKPGGLTVVRPGDEAAFLAPLPVRVIWGVGPVTAEKLGHIGVKTVGDLARLPERELAAHFGEQGLALGRRARGVDRRPVVTEHERKSVSRERTFSRDLREAKVLKRELWQLSQSVAGRLERAGVVAGTVAIKLRYDDFETLTRQMRLDVPTDDPVRIYRASLVLLRQAWERDRPVRLLGVGGSQLEAPRGQLPLF